MHITESTRTFSNKNENFAVRCMMTCPALTHSGAYSMVTCSNVGHIKLQIQSGLHIVRTQRLAVAECRFCNRSHWTEDNVIEVEMHPQVAYGIPFELRKQQMANGNASIGCVNALHNWCLEQMMCVQGASPSANSHTSD